MKPKSVLTLCIVLFTVAFVAHGQPVGSLIIFADGEFWLSEDGTAQPQPLGCAVSDREPIQPEIVLSPDGTRFAFRTQPEIVTDAIERVGGIGGGELPSDIWLCDLRTRELTSIAAQPDDAAFFAEDGTPDKAMIHGIPSWSPDGMMLAWTQFQYPEFTLQLATHDLRDGSTSVIVPTLPPQYGVPVSIEVTWGATGIAMISYEANETPDPAMSILVYDPVSGAIVAQLEFPEGYGMGAGEGLAQIYWLDDSGNEGLGIVFLDGHFEVFYPEIGTSERINGLELYALPTRDPALSMLYAPMLGDVNSWAARENETYTPLPVSPELYNLNQLAVSPAGDAVAYVDDQVYVWRNGVATPVPMTQIADPFAPISLAWSPFGWRAFRDEVPVLGVTGEPITCPGFMVSRLVVGESGRVSDDLPNNVRQEPNTNSRRTGEIPSGGQFSILAGPMCGENLAWWLVDYNGLVGWTAEGQGEEYWLEPVS